MAMGGPGPGEHHYRECTDEDCPAELCRIYQQGRSNGYDSGYNAGRSEGEAEGYVAGYREGHKDGSR
jgi:flagellar biosynthesis/type III secretory pathway protein FliH